MYEEELYHHGILGQRKGVRNGPPYPLSSGKHSAAEKKAAKSGISTLSEYVHKKKIVKKKKAALEKARQTKIQNEQKRKEQEQHEADKERVLKSGTVQELAKYRGEFTYQELENAIKRIDNENKIAAMAASERQSAADKVDKIMNNIDRARGWTEKGVNAYNTVAKIINAFNDEDALPIVGEKHKSSDEKMKSRLDVENKRLVNDNQKLKNELQKLQNDDQKLKNTQTQINIDRQKEKSNKKKNTADDRTDVYDEIDKLTKDLYNKNEKKLKGKKKK